MEYKGKNFDLQAVLFPNGCNGCGLVGVCKSISADKYCENGQLNWVVVDE